MPKTIIKENYSKKAVIDVSSTTKKLLKRYGISVLLAIEENVNPNTSAGLWLEGIRELKNEAHSMDISYNVIRGMSGNIKNRDAETGCCYKNGGRPPYGYQVVYLDRGKNSKGKQIRKIIWDLHPEHAPILRMIIVDLYTKGSLSYKKIRDYLNNNSILGPEGNPWGISTIVSILRDDRLEQYAGTAYWNKEDHHTVGAKFKPKEQWVRMENAHPAIITEEELAEALYRKRQVKNNAGAGRTIESPYLFTGKNLEDQSMFVCSACGGNVIGYRNSSHHWSKYTCGQRRYKGDAGCYGDFSVDQKWLEGEIIHEIKRRYAEPDRLEEIVKKVQQDIKNGFKDYSQALKDFEKQKSMLETELKRLLDAIKAGIDPSTIAKEANELSENIGALENKIISIRNNPPKDLAHNDNEIKQFFTDFTKAFDEASATDRKKLIRTFVRHLKLDQRNKAIRVEFYPDRLVHSIGARGPTLFYHNGIVKTDIKGIL